MHILSITLLSALTSVFAMPLKEATEMDIQVLAFADVLEQLESAFYTQALQKFNASNFVAAGFNSPQIPIQQFQTIASDENTHALTLQSAIRALGGQVISNCTFNFSPALVNVETMAATARVVENVGVSAYLGALTSLANPALVTAAGSIMTVEARHQTILNLLNDATSIPQPFDIPLTPAEVLSIADSFISGCKLGFSANPALTVTNTGPLQAGEKLNFVSPALNNTTTTTQLSCEIVTGASNMSIFQPIDNCLVPANVTGPMYVFITNDQKAIKDMNETMVVAGPALLFANAPDLIGNLIRPGLNMTGTTGGNPATASALPTTVHATTVHTTSKATGTTSAHSTTASVKQTSSSSPSVHTAILTPAEASAVISKLNDHDH